MRKITTTISQVLILITLHSFPKASHAQFDLARIDTGKWDVDTFLKTLIVLPKFELINDTSIYFYQSNIKNKVLVVEYRSGSGFVTGSFRGTKQFINKNGYVHMKTREPDSLFFINHVDTIIHTDGITQYCISLNNLGIRDTTIRHLLRERDYSGNDCLQLCSHKDGESFPSGCLLGTAIILNEEPPYESFQYLTGVDFRK